jgi:hypothetical protein
MFKQGLLIKIQLGKRIVGTTPESLEELINRDYPDLEDKSEH